MSGTGSIGAAVRISTRLSKGPGKNLLTITPAAVQRLRQLLHQPAMSQVNNSYKTATSGGASQNSDSSTVPIESPSASTLSETPRFLRISVKQKGCSGMAYALDYANVKQKFDEEVKQDGVTVLVDSKALFSIIGSEMDYVEDRLSSQFVFNNPNVKEACGCGQSFMV